MFRKPNRRKTRPTIEERRIERDAIFRRRFHAALHSPRYFL